MSFVFLVVGVVLTTVGFAARPQKERLKPSGYLALQVGGPVCLATTVVMLILGSVFSRLWKVEWKRRQRAMELRARHGASSTCTPSRTCYGHDEETNRVTEGSARSFAAT